MRSDVVARLSLVKQSASSLEPGHKRIGVHVAIVERLTARGEIDLVQSLLVLFDIRGQGSEGGGFDSQRSIWYAVESDDKLFYM